VVAIYCAVCVMEIYVIEVGKEMSEEILALFMGKVHSIEDGVAHISLFDEEDRESCADCDAAILAQKNIFEGNRFTYTVIQKDDNIITEFSLIPRRQLTDKEWAKIHEESLRIFGDYDPNDDY
jgi:hypothetical protein